MVFTLWKKINKWDIINPQELKDYIDLGEADPGLASSLIILGGIYEYSKKLHLAGCIFGNFVCHGPIGHRHVSASLAGAAEWL